MQVSTAYTKGCTAFVFGTYLAPIKLIPIHFMLIEESFHRIRIPIHILWEVRTTGKV